MTDVMDVVYESDEEEYEEVQRWAVMDTMDRVFYVIDFPFVMIRTLTLPPCDIKKYSKL